jgi:hypothetical protein
MKIGRGNRSTRRKPAPAPLCPQQILHDYTRGAAVGSQRLTAWSMARPKSILRYKSKWYIEIIYEDHSKDGSETWTYFSILRGERLTTKAAECQKHLVKITWSKMSVMLLRLWLAQWRRREYSWSCTSLFRTSFSLYLVLSYSSTVTVGISLVDGKIIKYFEFVLSRRYVA